MERSQSNTEILKKTMLKHDAMFKEQVKELHRLYQAQRVLMAESRKKDFVVFACSASQSSSYISSLSSFTTEPMKSVKGRNFWELTAEISNSANNNHLSKQEPRSPFSASNIRNMVLHDALNASEDLTKFRRKLEQRTFDLERPAEEYMDDEVQEEKFQDWHVSRIPTSIPCRMSAVHIVGQQSEVHSTLGAKCLTDAIDQDDRSCLLKPASSFDETVKESSLVLEHPRCSEELSSFRLLMKEIQQVAHNPGQLPIMNLFGELNQLNRLDTVPISVWQKSNIHHEGRLKDEKRLLDLEAGQKSANKNSKQPHWLLQEATASTNMLASNSSTRNVQNSGGRTLPFFLQKQNLDGANKTSLVSGEEGDSIFSCELGWSNVAGSQQHPMLTTETRCRGPASEILNWSASQPVSWTTDEYHEHHSGGAYMHHDHLTLSGHSDFWPHLSESQSPLKTQLLFHTELNKGASNGCQHDFAGKSLYEHGSSTGTHHEKQPSHQPLAVPLSGQRTCRVTPNVGLVVQPSAGPYRPFTMEVSHELTLEDNNKISQSVNYAFNSAPMCLSHKKQPHDMWFLDMTADTELTLGPNQKLMKGKSAEKEDLDSKETKLDFFLENILEKDAEEGSVKRLHWQKQDSKKVQSVISSISGSYSLYTEERVKRESMSLQQVIDSSEVISTNVIPDEQDLKMLSNGSIWRKPVNSELIGSEFGSITTMDDRHGVCMLRLPGGNTSEKERWEGTNHDNVSFHYNEAMHKEQVTLHNHLQESTAPEIGPGYTEEGDIDVKVAVDRKQCRHIDLITLGAITGEIYAPPLCSKAGLHITEEESGSVSCLGQVPEKNQGQNTYLGKRIFEARKDISGLVAETDLISKGVEAPNLASSQISNCDSLQRIENSQNCTTPTCSSSGLLPSDDADDTNQVVEALLSLSSCIFSDVERIEVFAACEAKRSLERLPDAVEPERNSCVVAGTIRAPNGSIQQLEMTRKTWHPKDIKCREDVTLGEWNIQNEEACPSEDREFFRFVTLVLKASGITTENNQHVLRQEVRPVLENGRSARRGRVRKDAQNEMPGIASHAQQEITEDLQTIGGLMKSATEAIMRKTANILCRNGATNSATGNRFIRSTAGIGGNCINDAEKAREEKQSLSSWGDGTRRRRMRRQRSRWSVLSSGTAASWEEPLGPVLS